MNVVTPRIFVAATQQNDGKTTTALGLFSAFEKKLGRIGFIKPVGQRFVEVDGEKIDEDSFLINETFEVKTPLIAMSPIAVEPDFTRKYIEHQNNQHLVKCIRNSFDRASWEKDFCIVEGTGHAGVGSVFDLSNARVARLLESKVILVTQGGIGRPIDEIVLNKALFDQEGVEVIGAIINKVLPEKFDYISDFARRGLERLGIDLLGVIPAEPILARATLQQVCQRIDGDFVHGQERGLRRVERIIIGAMNSVNVMEHFSPGTLVITPGDREDVILAALSNLSLNQSEHEQVAGLVLSGDLRPHERLMSLIRNSNLPTIFSPLDSYTVASRINSMTIKTLPTDKAKIEKIRQMIEQYVEIDRILTKIT
ncbi:MAG: phosphotransacetylase family protein [Verrucomicrobiales bacterium]